MQVIQFKGAKVWLLLVLTSLLAGCGINNIPNYDEQVKAAWAQVQNQYQRRADLIPNLVETVKGYAKQEQETLTAVIEARAKATSIQVDASTLDDPQKLQQFQQAQSQLTGALSRLMVVSERYPDLKSNQNFLALQSQLEGTENRIAVARKDFIAAVQRYNTEIRTFPGRLWHTVMYSNLPLRENFEATASDADKAPEVKF
ncbi:MULTISPECIES: LemA family protein [Pseudomonas]|uniref:LemA family protein n=1 Tax=Pseudomonas sp. Hg7Tf TaxID=3236988 RepID=A0AB39I5V5_9PSED|nr:MULTISPECIES: LemA family protein [Pseudomonas]KJK07104.1 lipoprotein [Pseudomonas sp. 5]MDD1978010.1 LemA family protein [Pseudomonas putida]MDH2561533.1 LemA family protein [Pseudomonas sp. Hg5Tf]QYX47383.1 LemA family protein [Pseudomonas sp. S11A 273]